MNAMVETYGREVTECADKITEKLSINSFTMMCVIGKGSYAEVILARKKDTGKIFALKILKKKKIEQRNQKEHVRTERNILTEMNHPFLIKMAFAFQNEKKLYFALEYCPGGELFNLLQKRRRFSEEHARFYITQMIMALEHLHKYDIIYRDLKPENVLIDMDGYIRLTDFGLSKTGIAGNKGAYSVCGTPEYLAPEILFQRGHGKAVDWWTLGAILFEMLTGLPPFYTPNREELFQKIKYYALKYPPYLSPNVKNLLDGLFQKEPSKRLGSGTGGAEEIKAHPWFQGVDWKSIYNKEIKAPFLPIIKSDVDVSNFDPEFTEAPIGSLGSITDTSTEIDQSYTGWSYSGNDLEAAGMDRPTTMEIE
jgi:serine/threonine protein kinase